MLNFCWWCLSGHYFVDATILIWRPPPFIKLCRTLETTYTLPTIITHQLQLLIKTGIGNIGYKSSCTTGLLLTTSWTLQKQWRKILPPSHTFIIVSMLTVLAWISFNILLCMYWFKNKSTWKKPMTEIEKTLLCVVDVKADRLAAAV